MAARELSPTSFMAVYDSFFARVTDNMYMELVRLQKFMANCRSMFQKKSRK